MEGSRSQNTKQSAKNLFRNTQSLIVEGCLKRFSADNRNVVFGI